MSIWTIVGRQSEMSIWAIVGCQSGLLWDVNLRCQSGLQWDVNKCYYVPDLIQQCPLSCATCLPILIMPIVEAPLARAEEGQSLFNYQVFDPAKPAPKLLHNHTDWLVV